MSSHKKEELWSKVTKSIREAIVPSKFSRGDFSLRAESTSQIADEPLFHVSYGPLPSKATVRTHNQFILLETRSGGITFYMLDIVKEVLEDLDNISRMLKKGEDWGGQEFLMFRGAWFDAKHGYHTKFCVMAHSRKVWKPGLDGV